MSKLSETLKTSLLFEDIIDIEIDLLIKCLNVKRKKYNKDEIIILAGENIPAIGMMLTGSAQIIKNDFDGNKTIIDKIEKAELFGETIVCADIKKSPVTVIACENCEVIFFDYNKIISPCVSSCSYHRVLIQNMVKIIARKNIMLNNRISLISERSTKEKLMMYLLSEKEKVGMNKFEIPFNRNELADFLCVERSAMSRELGKLRDNNMIKFNKNKFEIL